MVRCLEQITVGPSHYEVAVITVTSGISICKSKFEIRESVCNKEELEENREESNWVRFWANTSIIITDCRVSNMLLVIGSVKVFTIPARGKENLRSYCVAMMDRERMSITTRTKAHQRKSSVRLIAIVISSSEWVTGYHPEAIRKSHRYGSIIAVLASRCVVASPKQIVYRGTSPGHQFPHAVGHLVVHLRDPVVTVVDCLVAGGGIGCLGIPGYHGASEGVTSYDAVYVGSGYTRVNDRV